MDAGVGFGEVGEGSYANTASSGKVASGSSLDTSGLPESFLALEGPKKALGEIKSRLSVSFSGTALFLCDASNNKDLLAGLAEFVSSGGFTPVMVLFGSNYVSVSNLMRDSGFAGNYLILDCVSSSISQVKESGSVFFVDSMRNLTQIQIKIIDLIENNPKSAFIFDSLLVLSLYHDDGVVMKFVHSIVKLFNARKVPCYFISSQGAGGKIFGQFFDETIEIKKFY